MEAASDRVITVSLECPVGYLHLSAKDDQIVAIRFDTEPAPVFTQKLPEVLDQALVQMQDYLAGTNAEFSFSIQPSGTAFQQKVWEALRRIPPGQTISYQELANRLGDPKCIRAAAAANGRNPLGIAIPCHRVIGSDGSLTGYAGGLHRKQWLLDHERRWFSHQPVQSSLF